MFTTNMTRREWVQTEVLDLSMHMNNSDGGEEDSEEQSTSGSSSSSDEGRDFIPGTAWDNIQADKRSKLDRNTDAEDGDDEYEEGGYLKIDDDDQYDDVTDKMRRINNYARSDRHRINVMNVNSGARTNGSTLDSEEVLGPMDVIQEKVRVRLHDERLWRSFQQIGTEMIINRTGRRMFPHVVFSVTGLDERQLYSMALDIVPSDNKRYKYTNNEWVPMGVADPQPNNSSSKHPDSPNSGTFWHGGKISFAKVRLTNNRDASEGNVLLHSMHKYMARLTITQEGDSKRKLCFSFPDSSFIAVTAYQNNDVTRLKIIYNPFAKAFRDDMSSLPVSDRNISQSKESPVRHAARAPRRRRAGGMLCHGNVPDGMANRFTDSNVDVPISQALQHNHFTQQQALWLDGIDAFLYQSMLWRSLYSGTEPTPYYPHMMPYPSPRSEGVPFIREPLGPMPDERRTNKMQYKMTRYHDRCPDNGMP